MIDHRSYTQNLSSCEIKALNPSPTLLHPPQPPTP